MTWDLTINVATLVQVMALVGGIVWFGLRTLAALELRLSAAEKEGALITEKLDTMSVEMARQTDILISLARQDERLKAVEARMIPDILASRKMAALRS